MKNLSQTTQFARDVKLMRKRGKDLERLKAIVDEILAGPVSSVSKELGE